MYNGLNSFTLLAVPFFLLAGQLLNAGLITDRLVRLAYAMVGWVRGGLAHINAVVSMIFAGMSGSSTADVGAVLIPAIIIFMPIIFFPGIALFLPRLVMPRFVN